jgi:hypothetical protein
VSKLVRISRRLLPIMGGFGQTLKTLSLAMTTFPHNELAHANPQGVIEGESELLGDKEGTVGDKTFIMTKPPRTFHKELYNDIRRCPKALADEGRFNERAVYSQSGPFRGSDNLSAGYRGVTSILQ